MSIVLTVIPGAPGYQLDAPAAASLGRAIAAGCPVDITNAYRDPVWQQQLYDGWVRRLPGYNFALPPSQSHHCLGIAVDTTGAMTSWLNRNGSPYGWTRDANEAWHFDYDPARDVMAVSLTTTIGGVLPTAPADLTTTAPTEDDMFSDTDRALLQNVEDLLARGSVSGSGIRGDVLALGDKIDATRSDVGTVANEQRAGFILLGQQIAAGQVPSAQQIAAAIPASIARAVADELSKRLAQ